MNRKVLILCALLMVVLTGCHKHEYSEADCESPMTCYECGKTEGKPLGHQFEDATCEKPKICSECGETKGSALGHKYSDATCTLPQICSVCNKEGGSALGHRFEDATCKTLKTCSVCKITEGDYADHVWADATCEAPKTCTVCEKTEGEKLAHEWAGATFSAPKTCNLCSLTEGEPLNKAEFETMLTQTPVYVESTKYIVQDAKYKALYPDMLSAIIKNNSGKAVKTVVVAFAAWDKNNLPMKIFGKYDYQGSYIKKCNYGDVNMMDGTTFGKNKGMPIDYDDTGVIGTFKAIVVEYTDFEGNVWENPYYDAWVSLYENQILSEGSV